MSNPHHYFRLDHLVLLLLFSSTTAGPASPRPGRAASALPAGSVARAHPRLRRRFPSLFQYFGATAVHPRQRPAHAVAYSRASAREPQPVTALPSLTFAPALPANCSCAAATHACCLTRAPGSLRAPLLTPSCSPPPGSRTCCARTRPARRLFALPCTRAAQATNSSLRVELLPTPALCRTPPAHWARHCSWRARGSALSLAAQ
jgi:hypothetical protein